uniref:Ig-like domain-containing protein n=1 Tax=Strigamia maritima TaxID=126957 RepID=T1JIR8_STRMM
MSSLGLLLLLFDFYVKPTVKCELYAMLLQPYIVHIYDVYAILGNTAVMKCHVPTFLLDYVHVTSWIRDAAFVIQTTADKEGKYVILPSGELHIREVNPKDAMTNFRCQTHHTLTGETRLSASAGRLFVTEPQGNVSPRILTTQTAVHVRQGEAAILSCVAQGYPVPNTT